MKIIRAIKLPLMVANPEDHNSFLNTLDICAQVFNEHAAYGFTNRMLSKITMHKELYALMRIKYTTCPSAYIQVERDSSIESLKSMNSNKKWKTQPKKSKYASLRLNDRTCKLNFKDGWALITSVGRKGKPILTTFSIPVYYIKYLGWQEAGKYLVYRSDLKRFFLHVMMETEVETPQQLGKCLGIDKGVNHVVYMSDDTYERGGILKHIRGYYSKRRTDLQKLGTRSAKRKLQKIAGKEKRVVRDKLHCIAKAIVHKPYDTFALEKLFKMKEMRDKKNVKMKHILKKQGKKHRPLPPWAYREFDTIFYDKAVALGKQVIFIDSAYTSMQCSQCGYIEEANRCAEKFSCKKCNFTTHADYNASLNIRTAAVNPAQRDSHILRYRAVTSKHSEMSELRLSTDTSRQLTMR